ncbi:MAG: FAD-dependent oxidoreductase, partial [bacterium]
VVTEGALGAEARAEAVARFERERLDVLVIGGGITGVGIALDAVSRGLSAGLIEAVDVAAGTSSRSSKLIHGGLRYLEHGHLGLVREACRERERLVRLAPHLVRPLPFLLPAARGDGWPPLWMLRTGLWLYDHSAGAQPAGRHRMLAAAEFPRREPALAGRALTGGALYYDAQMDDARVTLETALGAAEAGAVLVNHAEVARFGAGPDGALGRAVVRDRLQALEPQSLQQA